MLVMYRNKNGEEYFTLVGGQINRNELPEDALRREVKEETGLEVISAQLVFVEEHAGNLNDQYIYLCQVAPHQSVSVSEYSEEGLMNRVGVNIHKPVWVRMSNFEKLPFRTSQLQQAITTSLEKGFPNKPLKISAKNSKIIIKGEEYP